VRKLEALIVATRNAHKTEEITALLGESFRILDLSAIPQAPEIEETGVTFLENAILKAVGISRITGGVVLADDSGLEVDALDGRPGVFSARFAGPDATDAANNEKLLRELRGMPAARRTARFRCTMVIAEGGEVLASFDGSLEGRLLEAPRGESGFGYDPLFVPVGFDETFAELGAAVKNQCSHRARAMAQVIDWLRAHRY
jgi:XTP/dITP diphosphohydrolase